MPREKARVGYLVYNHESGLIPPLTRVCFGDDDVLCEDVREASPASLREEGYRYESAYNDCTDRSRFGAEVRIETVWVEHVHQRNGINDNNAG